MKIIECKLEFEFPLSVICHDIIIKLLNPNPLERITIDEIKKHSFYKQGRRILNERKFDFNDEKIDELAKKKLEGLGFDNDEISERIKINHYDNLTTSYNLLCNKFKFELYMENKEMIENKSKY